MMVLIPIILPMLVVISREIPLRELLLKLLKTVVWLLPRASRVALINLHARPPTTSASAISVFSWNCATRNALSGTTSARCRS